ncbi:MAG: hypothetical protein ACYDAQ_01325 [Mycobacteriales bacterium]
MAVLALASAKGAPGASTTALALALVWPRPILLVECDPAGGDLLAGYLAGADPPGGGLLGLALAARHTTLGGGDVSDRALSLDSSGARLVLTAPADARQLRPITDAADRLVELLASFGEPGSGPDVILDVGRLGETGSARWCHGADLLVLLVRPTLRGASAARSRLAAAENAAVGGARSVLVLVGDGPYREREISGALALPVFGAIAHDPVAAGVLCGERIAGRTFDRSPLMRSARSLSQVLLEHLAARPGSPDAAGGPAEDDGGAARDSLAGQTA